ncbi:MAG: histidinol-phosphatase [Clostridia bacterium]|nr:histidinol-phosphatase [Clostridia bacterium]
MTANYHTHTARCGHASGTDREYVEKAIELGFSVLGFSEHAPMPFPEDIPEGNLQRLLSMRMKLHETDAYFESLLSLREEYKNDIEIHIGFEVEYFDRCFDSFIEYIKDYPVEYLILGQHFRGIYHDSMIYNGARTNDDAILKCYVDDVIAAIKTGKITYVAHPDLLFYSKSLEVYEREMTRLIKCANEHKIPLEFNFYGMQEVRNYPTFAFWQLAADIGCDVVFGSDAHKPENLLNPLAYKQAQQLIANNPKLNLLDRVEFKSVK